MLDSVVQELKLGWEWVLPITKFPFEINLILFEVKIMTEWSLSTLLSELHQDVERQLRTARQSFKHPVTKGDATEKVWLQLFDKYLPARYKAQSAHVVDSEGDFSDQIDIVIFDRQYSPFIFNFMDKLVIPAESVYAVFEAKQIMNHKNIVYAKDKVASVRRLSRTSFPITHAASTDPAKEKPPLAIIGGILTLESGWKKPFGKQFQKDVISDDPHGLLDIGCVAAHGHFHFNRVTNNHDVKTGDRAATSFLFDLIKRLQISGTVQMIDIQAYANWLYK
jgi:hypothetical protein